jgi:hypothetical protein
MQYVKLEDLVAFTEIEPIYYPEDVQSRIYTPDICISSYLLIVTMNIDY